MEPKERMTGMSFTRNIPSREGQVRLPSKEKDSMRKTNPTSVNNSQQNFFRTSQYKDNEYDMSSSQVNVVTDDMILNSLNIAIDETNFINTTKSDIFQLQEDINKLDFDGKIRNSNPSDLLKKNHIYSIMKFLTKNANQNVKKQLEGKLNFATNVNSNDLVKFMGVKDEAEGLKKLYRMTSILDLMLTKITEYQAIYFIKYDQIHESLKKAFNSNSTSRFFGSESGIQTNRFQLSLAIIDKMTEMYSFVTKLIEKNGPIQGNDNALLGKLKNITSIEEFYTNLRNGEHYGFPGEIVIKLMEAIDFFLKSKMSKDKPSTEFTRRSFNSQGSEQLLQKIKDLEKELNDKKASENTPKQNMNNNDVQNKINELNSIVINLRKENEILSSKYLQMKNENNQFEKKVRELEIKCTAYQDELSRLRSITNANTNSSNPKEYNSDYYLNMIKDLENNYKDKVTDLQKENLKLNTDVINIGAENEKLKAEIDQHKSKIGDLNKENEKLILARKKGDDSFEVAIREQFNNMKLAYEKKISTLNNDIINVKKDRSHEIIELRNQLSQERDNRELLVRQLQIYTMT